MLLAGVYLLFAHTGLALDMAAPPYLAVAGQCDEAQRRVVAAPAAKTAAARVLGAGAAGCSGRVPGRAAEARRLFKKHQLGGVRPGSRVTSASRPGQLCITGSRISDA